jgi:hypothetical protein
MINRLAHFVLLAHRQRDPAALNLFSSRDFRCYIVLVALKKSSAHFDRPTKDLRWANESFTHKSFTKETSRLGID